MKTSLLYSSGGRKNVDWVTIDGLRYAVDLRTGLIVRS
jgi:hypothetical protein